MKYDVEIVNLKEPNNDLWTIIGEGLHHFNLEQAGNDDGKPICFALKHDKKIVGGIIGETHWNWFYINLMYLKEDYRGKGYGRKLLSLAEKEARRRGVTHSYLDTFSFQNPKFYFQQGYEIFGELHNFPKGNKRYYLFKKL